MCSFQHAVRGHADLKNQKSTFICSCCHCRMAGSQKVLVEEGQQLLATGVEGPSRGCMLLWAKLSWSLDWLCRHPWCF